MNHPTINKILHIVLFTLMLTLILAVFIPVFFFDQFSIGGMSMSPALKSGDHIMVNKILFGARIYTGYDFSSPVLESFRVPGTRKICPGDIVVFNNPRGRNRKRIEFRINYVYVKRCIGCPGDSVGITNGYYTNNHFSQILGSYRNQLELSMTPDSVLKERGTYISTIPYIKELGWTIRDFGPIYIPKKGDTISMNPFTAKLYSMQIEYETGFKPIVMDGIVQLDGKTIDTYCFRGNWYFFGGDNVLDSKDSRYIGLVPEEYIVGIATRKLYNRNPDTGKKDFRIFFEKI